MSKEYEYKRKEVINYVEDAPTSYYRGNVAIPLYDMTSFQKMWIIKGGILPKLI